jgi:hypothetical protein
MLCFEPQGQLPVGDVMLAQKVALELFESKALRVANASAAQRTLPVPSGTESSAWPSDKALSAGS